MVERERNTQKKVKSDRDVKEAIRSGYLTINGASPNRSLCLCSKRWMNTGLKIVGFPALCECIQEPKVSLLWRQEKKKKRGEENFYGFLFFPFPSSACYNGFRMHARSMISPILFLLLFSKRKSRIKCPLMLMARSPPRSHHRFTTTFLSGSVYQNPGVCPFGWTINCLQTVLGGGAVLNV